MYFVTVPFWQIKFCDEPLDIFQFMFTSGISCQLAQFFIAWAVELENRGNTKKADAIYNQGIQTGAQPQDLLRKRHQYVILNFPKSHWLNQHFSFKCVAELTWFENIYNKDHSHAKTSMKLESF